MRHFPIRELGYAIGFVVLLAVLYVGSYYAMVERIEGQLYAQPIAFPVYRFGQNYSESLFRSMHCLDRKLRPEFWHAE